MKYKYLAILLVCNGSWIIKCISSVLKNNLAPHISEICLIL